MRPEEQRAAPPVRATKTRARPAVAEQLSLFASLEVEPVGDEATRRAATRLDRALVLRAGAGTGKTHTLVEAAVHLAAGTTALRRRVAPGRLLLVTFSEKAAAELRDRVRARFVALAQQPRHDERLERAYRAAGTPPLDGDEWRAAALALGSAPITTFHGFCAGLLRRHAAAAGLDPAFTLLDEDEAATVRRARTEEIVLASLHHPDVRELARQLDWSRADGFGKGLIEHVDEIAAALAEDGADAASLAGRGDDPAQAAQDWTRAAGDWLAAVQDVARALDGARGGLATRFERLSAAAPAAATALSAVDTPCDPLELVPLREVQSAVRASLGTDERNAAKRRLDQAFERLREVHAGWRAAPLARALSDLVARSDAAYDDFKRSANVLDLGDLVRRSRDLLRDDPAARAEEQARFDAVLIDELQDTNELQDQIVELVRPEGAPLLAVGDPKQSIYEFRGADVSVFDRVCARVVARGGLTAALTETRRARAPLARFVNRLFGRAMRGGAHPFEIAFDPERDALRAHRGGDGSCVELLVTPEARRGGPDGVSDEPARVARHLRALVDGRREVVWDKDALAPRPARWGDVAILLRRFTHLDAYLGQLRAAAIPHYVVNGRGFYEAQEIRDLAHALALLDDPDDSLGLLGVLRSPLVGLSDASLVALADLAPPRGVSPGALALRPLLHDGFTPPAALDPGEARRLVSFLATYRRLRRHADRVGAAGALRALAEETDLAAVLATTFYGEQKIANLERLLALAARHDRDGRGDRRAFARRLRAQIQRERSLAPPAQILGERDDVVRVMTVHQAKGLEFPVVFVPECGAPERENPDAVVHDRAAGLGLRLRAADGERVASPRARAVDDVRRARRRAESLRLFYVATTRARDLLVLSGEQAKRGDTWRAHVDELLAEDPEADALVAVRGEPEPTPAPVAASPPSPPSLGSLAPPATAAAREPGARWLRVLQPPASGARTLVAPVTELADFADCPRRFHLAHEVGLEPHADRPLAARAVAPLDAAPHAAPALDDADLAALDLAALDPAALDPAALALDPLQRGTLAHRLLEKIDLLAWRARGETLLDDLLAAEGSHPDDPDASRVKRQVAAFLRAPFGRELAARPSAEILREVPFALAVGSRGGGPRVLVKGQIDLVLLTRDVVTVIDYKLARAVDARDYRFQLQAYAAAARALYRRPARAGLVFLADRRPAPRFLDLTDAALDRFLGEVERLAAELATARRLDRWEGRDAARCRQLGCGYVSRCHPGAGGADAR